MNPPPQVEAHVGRVFRRSPSQGFEYSVLIHVEEISDTGRSGFLLDLVDLRSTNRDYIRVCLLDELDSDHRWISERSDLVSMISREATLSGFGRNGFRMIISVEITHPTVSVPSPTNNNEYEASLRMVLLGGKGLKSLKMETEPCCICLDNISGSDSKRGVTRMTCSHVFHQRCLLEWLKRKNTCPLCRTVLTIVDDFGTEED